MTNIVPCMGGFCSKRDGCAHYHSTANMKPSERLCGPGKDEPEPIKDRSIHEEKRPVLIRDLLPARMKHYRRLHEEYLESQDKQSRSFD